MNATKKIETAAPKQSYSAPDLRVVGTAVEMVQGAGGMSGMDSSYYRRFFN